MVEHEVTGILDRVSLFLSRATMMIVPFIMAIIFFEVVMRYFFLRPTVWVNEMSLWAGSFIYLLSGLYVMQQRAHIRIFMLYDVVSRPIQRVFDTISTALIILFAAALVWGGFNDAWSKLITWEAFGTYWNPPIPATLKPLVLIVVVLVALQSLSNLIHDWKKPKQTHELVPEDVIVDVDLLTRK
jgi:TRAP-type C4-dicarboxylate transport system permease small subunit